MGRSKGKQTSTYNKKKQNGPGITWQNVRDAVYVTEGSNVPRIVSKMFTEACRRGGLTKTHLYKEMIYRTIKEQLGEDEYNAMMAFLDKYDPPFKSQESREYWMNRLLKEQEKKTPE